ncbi:MAG TPA: hypothetical protein VNC11_03905 [Gemmatimonadaceae bacterium]|jgi:hypothetical protein|nr:hypothetical protein [Gemmatimonadaceae bacterium]
MRKPRPPLKGLWQGFDEANFGADRTLNLRDSLPSAQEARTRAESWLRMRQVMKPGDVLVITGRGNQSPGGVGVVREAIIALMPSLRRRGVVASWREHTPGSMVVTLAPITTLLTAPRRNREREYDSGEMRIATPESLRGLEPETLADLRQLAIRTIESLGVDDSTRFINDEMQRIFSTLTMTLPVSADRDGTLRRAIKSALEEVDG